MRKKISKIRSSFIPRIIFSRDVSNAAYQLQRDVTEVEKKRSKFLCLKHFNTVNNKSSKVVQENMKTLYTDAEMTVIRHNLALVISKYLAL